MSANKKAVFWNLDSFLLIDMEKKRKDGSALGQIYKQVKRIGNKQTCPRLPPLITFFILLID